MCKMKIKNFGPIKKGFESEDGLFEINSLVIFVGNQGSGKSTVAKLFSSLSWVQKALFSQKLTKGNLEKLPHFQTNSNMLKFQHEERTRIF